MAYRIDKVQGIGAAYMDRLGLANIKTTDDLLRMCCDPRGRQRVAERTGLSPAQLLEWSNMADLMRISGVGPQFAELLEAAGVDTIRELGTRNPENLAAAMERVNAEKRLARTTPAASAVAGWIEQARTLEPLISH